MMVYKFSQFDRGFDDGGYFGHDGRGGVCMLSSTERRIVARSLESLLYMGKKLI